MTARYLADTSALFGLLSGSALEPWREELQQGLIAICPVVELEFLFSARSLADRLRKQELLREIFGWVPMHDTAFQRAEKVQGPLTQVGHHRFAGAVDLLVAATAKRSGLVLMAEDRDYLAIAGVTGQPVVLVATSGPDRR